MIDLRIIIAIGTLAVLLYSYISSMKRPAKYEERLKHAPFKIKGPMDNLQKAFRSK